MSFLRDLRIACAPYRAFKRFGSPLPSRCFGIGANAPSSAWCAPCCCARSPIAMKTAALRPSERARLEAGEHDILCARD